ncbi:MAG TPA: molybdopterin-dependent oxidoreductase, partial [Anaerolineae bacterium]|nr:molybdopterin-dependent oxidoreductase [Anaerolineae bacterium]
LEVPENTTILKAAEQAGIVIPTLCNHKDLTPYGGCRLCSVDIQGLRLPATACTMLVAPGMIVHTESPALTRYRKTILELLLVGFYDAGYTHANGSSKPELDTQFAHWVNYYGIDMKSAMRKKPFRRIDSDPNPFIWVDKNKCIMCTRCVRACAEVQGRFVWTQAYRGYDLRIVAGAATTMLQARCESCGACVAHCPTGALDNKPSVKLGPPDRLVTTTCSYCGVGCQLDLNIKDDVPGGRVLRVTSNAKAPINGDHLCVKGRYGYDFIQSPNRLKRPRVRKYLLDGTARPNNRGLWTEVAWETALDIAAKGLQAARDQYGPNSIGLLTSGRSLNEENYLMSKLARQLLGTNNIDCCDHVNHANVVDGLDAALGLNAQSNSLDDVAHEAKSILIIGSNTSEQQPIFGVKLRQSVLRHGCKLVVAHPDFINMAEYATLRLIHRPGTEAALVNGLMHIILKNGWEDRAFIEKYTAGFQEFASSLNEFTPEYVVKLTGVEADTLQRAAEILAKNRPTAIVWGVDLAKHPAGRHNVIGLINLQLLLGNFGVPGGGLIPLRTQNNSQGACDMGGHPKFYPGYQPVDSESTRKKFEAAWGKGLPTKPGLTAAQMMGAAAEGKLRALFILSEDVVAGAPASLNVRRSLHNCDFVVQLAAFDSETSYYADVLLPGVTFAEKTGTFTNTERRIQMVHQAIDPQGGARPDWQIIMELARRIQRTSSNGEHSVWAYADTSQIMVEVAALTPIYAGVSHDRLERANGLQWPVKNFSHPGTPILSMEHFAGGRGKFILIEDNIAESVTPI